MSKPHTRREAMEQATMLAAKIRDVVMDWENSTGLRVEAIDFARVFPVNPQELFAVQVRAKLPKKMAMS